MVKNYIKIALRNLWRNKIFSIINIVGLAAGIAFSLLILLWIQNELSVDAYHINKNLLYQVYAREYYDHKIDGNYDTPPLLAAELKRKIPEIEYAVTLEEGNRFSTFRAGNKMLKAEGTAVRPDLFKMFSYKLLQGTPESALNSISAMAISRKMAGQFFGRPEAAIGKTIRFENERDFIITAVFENLPENTSRKFDYLMNWEAFVENRPYMRGWDLSGPQTYIQLRHDADAALVEKKITHFLDGYKKQDKTLHIEYGLQLFSESYLHNYFVNGKIYGGRIEYINLFGIIAVFILIIACINFMNLTTARSFKRAREIGVRKVVGAVRSVLIIQFIGEALLLTALAVALSLILVKLLLPVFNDITGKQIGLPFDHFDFWLKVAVLTLVTGCVSGSYPAFVLSAYNPATVLKGNNKLNTGAVFFRKGLVVFQFMLSIILIIGTIIVSAQIRFIQNRNLGYDRENLVYIPMDGNLSAKYEVFKNYALRMPGIKSVSHSADNPTDLDNQTTGVDWDGHDPNNKVQFSATVVGYDFVSTMKLNLLQGRDFSPAFSSDSSGFLINEAAVNRLGYKDPIGKRITLGSMKGHIIGVLKDFNFESLHQQIQPLIIRFDKSYGYEVLVRTQPGKTSQALAGLENLYKNLNPDFPFTYTFSDQEYEKLYKSEQVVGRLSNTFALLAIFISCLGLLGLASFTTEQRVREIGIRKILGASVRSLFLLLSSEFLILILIALTIASPLAWLATNKWLQSFAYRTNVGWPVFVLAALLVMGIALITISFQILKAALLNPVKNLKSE